MEWVLGLMPWVAIVAAAGLRLVEHWLMHHVELVDGRLVRVDLSPTGKLLVELLSASSQVLIVAAGVALALTWTPWP